MKTLGKLLGLVIYYLSYLSIRSKRIWAFGSGTSFEGNSKYLMEYLLENHQEVTSVWITKRRKEIDRLRSKGIRAYSSYSMLGLFYSFRAGYYIVSDSLADINFYTSGGALYIQLWHGIGIKSCLWNNKKSSMNTEGHLIGYIKRPSFYIEPDFILGASDMMNVFFSKMFRASRNKCFSFQYPRNNILQKSYDDVEKYINRWEGNEMSLLVKKLRSYQSVYLYMPTYRDGNPHFLAEQQWDYNEINKIMIERNSLLLIKLHPHMLCEINYTQYSNIIEIDNQMDVYPIMPFTQTLITDYSSVYYDYILMNDKQIILYVPDEFEYTNQSRELLMPYDESYKGNKVKNYKALINALRSHEITDYRDLRLKFWGNSLNTTIVDLYKAIKQL